MCLCDQFWSCTYIHTVILFISKGSYELPVPPVLVETLLTHGCAFNPALSALATYLSFLSSYKYLVGYKININNPSKTSKIPSSNYKALLVQTEILITRTVLVNPVLL